MMQVLTLTSIVMKRRILILPLWLLASALALRAEPYWVAYEGNDYPENQGWERTFTDPNGIVGQGGAIRTLENGHLIIDSREDVSIVDFYELEHPVDPPSGEMFIMRWRLRVDQVSSGYAYDPSIGVFSDVFGGVAFEFAEDGLRSVFEGFEKFAYAPGVFHGFEFVSSDMMAYELSIDGSLLVSGEFDPLATSGPRVYWGDSIQGGASLATWDRFEFGTVPEPNGGFSMVFLLIILSNPGRLISLERQ
jgi:hypothetical protein